jgi:hypothetical protein
LVSFIADVCADEALVCVAVINVDDSTPLHCGSIRRIGAAVVYVGADFAYVTAAFARA